MATILLVEDAPDLGLYEAAVLRSSGHQVLSCNGGPTQFGACPMLKYGSCVLPDSADLIVFSMGMIAPVRGRTYRGAHLLQAYRNHPVYGRLPMLVVSVGAPQEPVGGTGPFKTIDKFSSPDAVIAAVEGLLSLPPEAEPTPRRSPAGGHEIVIDQLPRKRTGPRVRVEAQTRVR